MRLQKAGADETYMVVTGGFLEVRDDKVVILAESAERAEEIDIALAQEARARAERMLAASRSGSRPDPRPGGTAPFAHPPQGGGAQAHGGAARGQDPAPALR